MILRSPLYVVCDADACDRAGWTLVDFATACLEGGAEILQVRAKHASSRRLLDCATTIVERAAAAGGTDVIVNDRADIARLARATGLHVGQDDLSPTGARRVVGDDCIVGLSTHTLGELERALAEPVSYVAVGPVFGTTTKDTGRVPLGLQGVRQRADIAAPHNMPVVAIGGITLERAASVIASGADVVAVIGDLLVGNDPRARVRDYLTLLSRL